MLSPPTDLSNPTKLQQILTKLGHNNTAYLCWVIASILWNIGFIYPTQHALSVQLTNLSRGIGLCIVNCIGMYWRHIFNPSSVKESGILLDNKALLYVSIRHILLALYGYGFVESHYYLPSPILYTIYFSGPLFVMMLEWMFYSITLSTQQFYGVFITGTGVLLTANGPAIWMWLSNTRNENITNFQNYKTNNPYIVSLVALILIILTFGWACAVLIVRQVKGYSHFVLNFNLGYILTISSAFLYIITKNQHDNDNIVHTHTLTHISFPQFIQCIIYQGLPHAFAQLFFMVALLLTNKSGSVCMIGFISVIFSYGVSIWRYGEQINYFCVVGSVIALLGIYCVVIK